MQRRHFPWLPMAGFALLSGIAVFLFAFTAWEAWMVHPAGGLSGLIVLFGLGAAIFFEGQKLLECQMEKPPLSRLLWEFSAVFAGGLLAYTLSHDIGLGAVVAASLVAIIANLAFPNFAVPFYCGAFVGMTSSNLLYTHAEVALAAGVAAGAYLLTRRTFQGVGGKLGTIALAGTALTGMGLSRQFLLAPVPNWETAARIMLIALIATPLTFYFNINRQHGPVVASAVVGLVGGLILPALFPETGQTLAVVMICASFTGMSSGNRCQNFWQILLSGLATGIIFIFSAPLLGGAGGKLGTIAFGSVLSVCGYTWLFNRRLSPNQGS